MTEWDAAAYDRRSALQRAMAGEVLALLGLKGAERVLDVGCGNGATTAEIAARVPQGEVLGVDASRAMVEFASNHFGPDSYPNLRFEVADARRLTFHQEFDFAVSLNALHWVPEQDEALRSIHSALKPGGLAQLRLVPRGKRQSIENAIEETRHSDRWRKYFQDFHDPYLHLTPEEYGAATERNGFRVLRIQTEDKIWDFGSRETFFAFSSVTMTEWTRMLPESEKPAFITDVLDRYRGIAADGPEQQNAFKFYQMDVRLLRP